MGKRFNVIGMILVVMMGISTARADDPADVREAAISFTRALAHGNAEQARQLAVDNKTNSMFIDLIAGRAAAEIKLRDAAASRFGKEGAAILKKDTSAEAFNQTYDPNDFTIMINGDGAQIIAKPKADQKQPEEQPALPLKRVDGKWKVDPSQLKDIDAMPGNAPGLKMQIKAIDGTADEVKAGKYATVHEAQMALVKKVEKGSARLKSGAKH